ATIQEVIKRYSSFVRFNIKLNGKVANSLQALWTKPKNEVTDAQHQEFYQFISRSYDKPMFHLHFTADSPLSIQSIFYIPGQHSEKYGMGRMDPGVSLYSRRVMIQANAKGLLPEWLRFIKGVVDSDDIPLNLSRELLQDSAIIQKLNTVLTRRILKFLSDQALSDPDQYEKFFSEFGQFLKEGACTDAKWKEELGRLVRFDSSLLPAKKVCSLDDYISRMKPDQEEIYYLVVPSRNFAETSPYYEGFHQRGIEVLFLYTSLDDFMMGNLQTYAGKRLTTIESAEPKDDNKRDDTPDSEKEPTESADFGNWLQDVLDERVSQVKTSTRLVSSPAVIVDHESASFRRMMTFVDPNRSPKLPKQIMEYNPKHPIIKQLHLTRSSNPELASLVAEQIFDDALIAAGLMEDPRVMIPRMNSLLEAALRASNKVDAIDQERVDSE
ncbi:MAG: molecular chaperone HtpG, partial [archaeon]|nr:molecular chaperone HtpG [archaeon]